MIKSSPRLFVQADIGLHRIHGLHPNDVARLPGLGFRGGAIGVAQDAGAYAPEGFRKAPFLQQGLPLRRHFRGDRRQLPFQNLPQFGIVRLERRASCT